MKYEPDELLILVRELSDIYTGRESTSITYEVAQQLMDAVLYCIHENDLKGDEPQAGAIISDKKLTAREAYDNGYRLVIDKIKRTNDLYNKLIIDFNYYGNRAYYDTVVKGIPEFFKWYDPRLNPMDHLLLVDYTVLENINGLSGIDFIYPYLNCIEKEQSFLRKFPEEYIRDILLHFHTDYEELFFNICAVVLKRVLVNMLLGVRLEKVKLEQDDYTKLSNLLSAISTAVLEERLESDLRILITNIYSGDGDIYKYLTNEVPNIAAELKNANDNKSLGMII